MYGRSATVTVLIYSRPDSLLKNAADLHLEETFREEGYKVLFVKSQRELALAIQSGVGDVVIADIADAPSIVRMASPASFVVVPVLAEGYKESELDSRSYAATIKSATKPGRYLDAVDRALDSKQARQNAKLRTGSASYQ
jgi:ketopantoate hydroxymethyltransferase